MKLQGKTYARLLILILAALAVMPLPKTAAASYTLVNPGTVQSVVEIDPGTQAGMFSWIVDGQSQLKQQWWWFRIADAAEQPIDLLGPATVTQYSSTLIDVLYTGNLVDVTMRYSLTAGALGSGNSTIAESVRIKNKSSAPIDFHLFEYTDFDLGGTPDDDIAALVNQSTITQWDGGTICTETSSVGGITPIPTAWEITGFPSLLDKLNDAAASNLDNAVQQFGPGNASFAFQWDYSIAPGATKIMSKSKVLRRAGSIGDTVWYDVDADGSQQLDEPGISGVKVFLEADLDGDGVIDYTTNAITDGSGSYLFANLPGGIYRVTVDPSTLPAGMVQTFDLDGLATPNTAGLNLASGEVNLDVDFGYTGTAAIGDTVWLDVNADGIQQESELGIADVDVILEVDFNNDSVVDYTESLTTDASGKYLFDNLPAGNYTVSIDDTTLPAGLAQTYDLDGLATPNTANLDLGPGEVNLNVDFGYTGVGKIGDTVWFDTNGDGVQQVSELGIPNVKVILEADFDNDGSVDYTTSAITDANGKYLFVNLPEGKYTVSIDTSTLPAGLVQTYDLDGLVTPHTAKLDLGPGETNLNVDFGYTKKASICGIVFRDCNANHKLDAGEDGLSGVTVVLKNSSGNVIATTVTSGSGSYSFSVPQPGTYYVCVSPAPTGYTLTHDPDCAMDGCTKIVVKAGDSLCNINFGYAGSKPSVLLEKTGPATACVGEKITYHFKVTNTGNTCLYGGVTVYDAMLGGKLKHWTPVLPGEVHEFDVTYTVRSCDPRPLINTAKAVGCPPTGPQVTSTSTWTVQIKDCSTSCKPTTYTQGGWGACPSGNNPGALLAAKFSKLYPCGLKVGGCRYLKFTSAKAIASFLPQGGTSGVLSKSSTNPCGRTNAGVFAGQVVALRLNVDFSKAGITCSGLPDKKVKYGKLAGWTVAQVLSLAEKVLGGDTKALPYGMKVSDLNYVVTQINENYEGGTVDKGYLF